MYGKKGGRQQPLSYAQALLREKEIQASKSARPVLDDDELEPCALCHKRDTRKNLLAACACHKKSDSNLVHRKCLEEKFNEHESDEPLRCETCNEPYKVSVKFQFLFAWRRFLTARSLGHLFELIIVVCMILCLIFTFTLFRNNIQKEAEKHPPDPKHPPSHAPEYLFYGMFALILVLIPLTLHKVYQRWRRANAAASILPV